MPEFDLIARIRARALLQNSTGRDDVILGIGDDAALLRMPPGKLLVVATDTLNAGVHLPTDTAPADIGWKALAVNLSDLAAMGAQPAWCTLSLSLPDSDVAFVDNFLDGFLALGQQHDVALVGGDTTRGPLSVCVTVHGFVDPQRVLRRDVAQVGDDVWVTGTLGDAAAALVQLRAGGAADPELKARLDRPTPRIQIAQAIASIANACIDISDGLLADLGHVCIASGVGADIELRALPTSAMLEARFNVEARRVLQSSGGDDYELCFTAAPVQRNAIARISREDGVAMTRIGRIIDGAGLRALRLDGREWLPPSQGYVHFS